MRQWTTVGSGLLCAALVSGCGLLDLAQGRAPVTAQLQVFNRTEMEIVLVAADGERLEVPACGQARDLDFRIDEVKVGANELYVRAFGVSSEFADQDLKLIELADAAESGIPFEGPAPDPLPPCRGDPQFQPGVPLAE